MGCTMKAFTKRTLFSYPVTNLLYIFGLLYPGNGYKHPAHIEREYSGSRVFTLVDDIVRHQNFIWVKLHGTNVEQISGW